MKFAAVHRTTGHLTKREFPSGPNMTASEMVTKVKDSTRDWHYEAVTIGYPGPVKHGCPVAEPHNLADGWVGHDFEKSFGCPVRIINDAAMQALGDYCGGRMLFLGLGTGLGSALIVDDVLVSLELAHLPYRKGRTYEDVVGLRGLERIGRKRWRKFVQDVAERFKAAFEVDDLVLGGGNVNLLKALPAAARRGNNDSALVGGFLAWKDKPTENS